MAHISIAILGLGRIGASVGLALKRSQRAKDARHTFEIVGSDGRASVQKAAAALGTVDKQERSLFNAVLNKDIIILALPYAEVEAFYEVIPTALKSGAVILDTSPLKVPSLAWAKKHLSDSSYMVGWTPIINPKYLYDGVDDTEHAAEDYFDSGSALLMPSPGAIKDAVELAADFTSLLGSAPLFVDPAEHDGIMAITEGLPALLGVATFRQMHTAPGWQDSQRYTNNAFGRLTHHLYDTHPDDLRDLLLNNREHMTRTLDAYIASLRDFRALIAEGNTAAVEAAVINSAEAYEAWINRRHSGKWGIEPETPKGPSLGDMMSTMVGSAIASRFKRGKSDEE